MKPLSDFLKISGVVSGICIVLILITELFVRIVIPQNRMVTWLEMHEEGFMMNQQGGQAFQEFGDRNAFYRFNEQRLRGQKIKDERVKVLTLGDSFTFGLLLDEEDTFVQKLQRKADTMYPDSILFLNGGIGGSGLADYPLWLEEFGEEISPQFIIYFMNYDDINRALSKNLFISQDSLNLIRSQRWEQRSFSKKIAHHHWYRWLQTHSDLFNILVKILWKNVYFEDLTHNFDPDKSEVQLPSLSSFEESSNYSNQLTVSLLSRLDNWCKTNNCELMVITTGFFEIDKMSVYDRNFYEFVSDSISIPFDFYYDNSNCVAEKADGNLSNLKIPEDGHPNENGAQAIADCSWNILVNKLGNQ